MVSRLIARIAAPVRGLHQAAYVLAGLTLVAQLLSLLRDRLFATAFGAGAALDVYYAAFKIPDLVFAGIASLVSAYVLIPRLAGMLEAGERDRARRLIGETSTFLLVAGGVLAALLAIAAPSVLPFVFPTITEGPYAAEFIFLSRILLLQPLLLGLSGIFGSATQLDRRFLVFALSPILYNAGIILGIVLWYPAYGLAGVGYGVLLGALLHVMVNVPVLARTRLWPRFGFPTPAALWSVVRDSVPRSLALSMGSLSVLVLASIASRIEDGSVAVLTLAGNLAAVPLALIGAAYATAAFPVLAEQAADTKRTAFTATLTAALRHIIFWSSVLGVLAIVLRAYIVRAVYGAGAFDWDDTRLTAALLAVFMTALIAQGVTLLCSRAFYATGRSWQPLAIQAIGVVLSVAGALGMLALVRAYPIAEYFIEALLRIDAVPGSAVVSVAIGAALGQVVMGLLSLISLRTVAPGVARSLMRPLLEGLGAAILGGTATYAALAVMGTIAPLTSLATVLAEGLIAGIVGLAIAGSVLGLLENQEFRDLLGALRRIKPGSALSPYSPAHDRSDP